MSKKIVETRRSKEKFVHKETTTLGKVVKGVGIAAAAVFVLSILGGKK